MEPAPATPRTTAPQTMRAVLTPTDSRGDGSRPAEPRPDVLDESRDRCLADRGREVERPGGEDLRAAQCLVIGHLGGSPRAHQVGDRGQELRPRWRRRSPGVDLDSVAAEAVAVSQARAHESPWRGRCTADEIAALPCAVVARRVLDADERRLRPSEPAPELDAGQMVSIAAHLPEEVVRGQEHQVAAEVAIALDDVVLPLRHVLRMAWKDD